MLVFLSLGSSRTVDAFDSKVLNLCKANYNSLLTLDPFKPRVESGHGSFGMVRVGPVHSVEFGRVGLCFLIGRVGLDFFGLSRVYFSCGSFFVKNLGPY